MAVTDRDISGALYNDPMPDGKTMTELQNELKKDIQDIIFDPRSSPEYDVKNIIREKAPWLSQVDKDSHDYEIADLFVGKLMEHYSRISDLKDKVEENYDQNMVSRIYY